MYDTLNRDTRYRIYGDSFRYKTLTPSELIGQRNTQIQASNKQPPREHPKNESVSEQTSVPSSVPTPSPYQRMPLQVGLDVSYAQDEDVVMNKLEPYGYTYDKELSTKENKVFYNPNERNVVMSVAGTDMFNIRDLGTDAYLGLLGQSGLKQTNRYKEAEDVMTKVRGKYKGAKKTLIGHSLGSAIINTLANEDEYVKGFGTGSGIFKTKRQSDEVKPKGKKGNLRGVQPIMKKNDKTEVYRTAFDPYSYTSSDVVIAEYKPKKRGNLRSSQTVDYPKGFPPSHSYQHLKNKNIFV
jgi:hypothetical protein